MNKKIQLLTLLAIVVVYGCESQSGIEGLWVVKTVKAGDEEMTPNARWTRFNADATQQSGNGWFQHSYGTWNLDKTTHQLTIINTNGIKDHNPFTIHIDGHTMYWNRQEDGQHIKVVLERSETLPQTYGDQLLGLWKLEDMTGNGPYFTPETESSSTNFLFLRWDKRFVINSAQGRINGVYNANAHRPEVELIPYGDTIKRNFWKLNIQENSLILTLLNSDSLVTRKFIRSDQFPE